MRAFKPTRHDVIADLVRVHLLNPEGQVTRNYYRGHAEYSESDWQYYFPTFTLFLHAAGLDDLRPQVQETFNPEFHELAEDIHDLELGDTFFAHGKCYKLLKRRGSAVTVRRHYWFDKVVDWLAKAWEE